MFKPTLFLSPVLLLLSFSIAQGQEFLIGDANEFAEHFSRASAGDRLVLLPGVYPITRMSTRNGGRPDKPVVVSSQTPGTAIIQAQSVEALAILHPHWTFENLTIRGNEKTDHAFHLSGQADYFTLRNSTLENFHSHIKSNGSEDGAFPDYARILNNTLVVNAATRFTAKPVAFIDVVGGKGWHVKANFIADFAKGEGDNTSYGAFLKGGSRDGVIDGNLVICSRKTTGGIRVGISFGGGGTEKKYCEDKRCTTEHRNGVIHNNIILNCSDVGIYLNKASNTRIEHNTLLFNSGIDVRFEVSSAHIKNNIVSGSIRSRDEGLLLTVEDNITTGTSSGMLVPAIRRKLKNRIDDYDSKFPNWFDRQDIYQWQQRIDTVTDYLAGTDWGLGMDTQKTMFPNWFQGDLTPASEWIEPLKKDAGNPDVTHDFWGTERDKTSTFVGAIDYNVSPCDIKSRIARKDIAKAKPCIDIINN